MVVVGIRSTKTNNTGAVINLVHVGVDGGTPGSGPEFLSTGIQGVPEDVGICRVVDLQFDADVGEGFLGTGQDGKRRMITSTATRDDHFVIQLRACRSGGNLAVCHGVTSGFKETKGSLFSSSVFLFRGHLCGVNGFASNISRERNLVILISRLRSRPGGIRDWVVDDGSGFTVVAINSDIAIDCQDGGKTLAQVLGGIGGGFATNVDGSGIDASITVAEVVDFDGGDHITCDLTV